MKDGMQTLYKATNRISGKSYIGLTDDYARRKAQHLGQAKRGSLHHFHCALRKYGAAAFDWSIIETCKTVERASAREIDLIKQFDTFNSGYNMTTGGERIGPREYRAESRDKMSRANRGKVLSPETRALISAFRSSFKSSPETCAKISAANKGRRFTAEHKAKIAAARTGRPLTAEHRAAVSKGKLLQYAQKRLAAA